MRAVTILLTTLAVTVVVLTTLVPLINGWEHDHNYPYGRMCNSVFTGWSDTCPK
jgi:hypothetical protein